MTWRKQLDADQLQNLNKIAHWYTSGHDLTPDERLILALADILDSKQRVFIGEDEMETQRSDVRVFRDNES